MSTESEIHANFVELIKKKKKIVLYFKYLFLIIF